MLHYETIPVTPFQQNCTVVWEDQGMTAAIIDPGGDLDMLQSACKQLGVKLVAIWIDGLQEAAAGYGFPPSRAFTPTRWLDDGDTVNLGAHSLQVRHCPGHTPGHVVFYSPELKRAFVGDVLFAGSITQRLWPMGDDTVFIPGHGPESTFGRERRSNPYVGGT